jgi:branched-chain amino acid transport system ATP-binding protein
MIRISDLTVKFGGVTALSRIDLTMSGKVIGIIGPNGAGKTTFLNVFSGFVTPRTGSIEVDGIDLLRLSPYRRARWGLRRGFQQEQTVEEMTVDDNIRVVLDPLGYAAERRNEHVAKALAFAGLGQVAGARVRELNAMQRRMTEIARCVAGEPRIVMLDEPGAGFAQAEVDQLRLVIAGIHAFNGATTLLIDHDVELIRSTCDATVVLDFGSLVVSGPTAEVLADERVRAVYLGMEDAA